MKFIGFLFRVFKLIIIIMALLYMCFRSLTFSSSSFAAAADDDANIPYPLRKYDVFINFRGGDTRLTFTSHLLAALDRRKIDTYIDYRIQRGDELGEALLTAIKKSSLSVIIFSKDYTSSIWCLRELAHILDCKKKYGQYVVPIFYDISPLDVQTQQGSYAQLEQRFKDVSIQEVNQWRAALTYASNLCGFDISVKTGTEANFVEEVVEDILTKLNRETSCILKGLVGLKSSITQIESLLRIPNDSLDVFTVGIWGMGGIGKTTLAKAVFDKLSSKFEASCFLRNVREKSEQAGGQDLLEKELLSYLLKEKDPYIGLGSTYVRERLGRTKVLIVFDDVSDSRQIEHLAADHLDYGPGSRIIITSRDRSQLMKSILEDDKIYKIEGLNREDALSLFRLHAFKDNSPITDYVELEDWVLDYAGGLPLALKIVGSLLHRKSKQEWKDEFDKLKEYPREDIHKVLRLSYDGLGKNEREIFLNIACFYKDHQRDMVERMLDVRGFFAAPGIKLLIDMSLISISTGNFIEMHDLVQEMGLEIVHNVEPIQCRRLFTPDTVYKVFKNEKGTVTIQVIFFYWSEIGEQEQHFDCADLKKMCNLRFLIIEYSSRNDSSFAEAFKVNTSLFEEENVNIFLFEERYVKFSLDLLNFLNYPSSPGEISVEFFSIRMFSRESC